MSNTDEYPKFDLNNEHIHLSKRLLHQMTYINNKVKGMQSMHTFAWSEDINNIVITSCTGINPSKRMQNHL